MSAGEPEDWTLAIERVLRADTLDLRALALLARADPRDFYVGTSLDGVDIRGQDLRGMAFTDLDLRRARHDEDTLIDPPDAKPIDPERRPSIFLATDAFAKSDVERALSALSPLVFDRHEREAFAKSLFRPAVAIVLGHESDLSILDASVTRSDGRAQANVLIVQGKDGRAFFKDWTSVVPGMPIVFCAEQKLPIPPRLRPMSPDVVAFCELLTSNSAVTLSRLEFWNILLRARGLGPSPVIDAAGQIFDRIWREGLKDYRAQVIANVSNRRVFDTVATLLQPKILFEAYEADGAVYALMAITEPREGDLAVGLNYASLAMEALHVAPATKLDLPVTLVDAYRTQVQLVEERFALSRLERKATTPLARFQFSRIREAIISPSADISFVVQRLLTENELWVSSRDLLAAAGEPTVSIWSLLAGQVRRVITSSEIEARQTYFELILRAGLRRSKIAATVKEALRDPDIEIRVNSLIADAGMALLNVGLYSIQEPPTGWPLLRGEIHIDPDGIRFRPVRSEI